MKQILLTFIGLVLLLSLSACGGGGGGGTPTATAKPATAATPTLNFAAIKTFHFTWKDVSDATYYKLLENPDGFSGFTQVGSNIPQGIQKVDHVVPLYARINAQYILESCNTKGCTDASTVSVSGKLVASIGYLKASNTGAGDFFGYAVSLSGDGNTLAVGAKDEDSAATGINPAKGQANNLAADSGAVYVFTRSGTSWSQQAYIKASNTGAKDYFGTAVSLSTDGNTLAVGAKGSSEAYIFTRSNKAWSQTGLTTGTKGDEFGDAVSLSGDGNTLAVGADLTSTPSTTIYDPITKITITIPGIPDFGGVYVFTHSGTGWNQQAYVKASNAGANDNFGNAVSLSRDGNTLAVGALNEDSNATTINGADNNLTANSGAVYVFTRSATKWTQQAYVKDNNTKLDGNFGNAVSLSGNGNILAVGAVGEYFGKLNKAGAVYVFARSVAKWSQQDYIKANTFGANDYFGQAVSLSTDGNTLAVGAWGEASNARGIGGNPNGTSMSKSGAVYVFTHSGAKWSHQVYVKASNTEMNDSFGHAVGLSGDGNTLAVGANNEASSAIGTDSNKQSDNSMLGSGAVYLY